MAKKKLYIVHGWAYSLEPWQETVDTLKALGVEVVQLKVPGLTEPSDEVWTIDMYVDWLKGQFDSDVKPVVLAHSNGGRIALNFLTKHPSGISRLILLNSAGMYDSSTFMLLKRKLGAGLAKVFRVLKRVPLAKKVVYKLLGARDYDRAPDNMKQTLQNMISSDKNLDISGLKGSTSLLWGLKDQETTITNGRKINGLIEGSSLREFENWGHAPYRTHPKELAGAIIEAMEEK